MTKITLTKKRAEADKKKANWERRLQVLMLSNQGISLSEVGKRLKPPASRQAVFQMYSKIKHMTVQELEDIWKELDEN